MKLGLVGKPNVGKSTFFVAATSADAAIGNYPFTTIEPNHGMAYVRVEDPGPQLGVTSTPRSGNVAVQSGKTVRLVPVELVDVAGLVPGASEGRGLGNRFLSDLNPVDALLHVVDASGTTDAEGNTLPGGGHDVLADVAFLDDEMDAWIAGLLAENWDRLSKKAQMENRKVEAVLAERLGGIGVSEAMAAKALRDGGLAGKKITDLGADLRHLAGLLRRAAKPMVIILNKSDLVTPERVGEIINACGKPAVPASAQSELALVKGAAAGLLTYTPGAETFAANAALTPAQAKGLQYIQEHVLARFGQTGVTAALEHAVFQLLGRIPVFPVEDESKFTDKEGRVLPDCHLVPQGTTAKQLAYRVHTDLGDHFIRAIDCKTHRVIGADYELKAGDVVKIVAKV